MNQDNRQLAIEIFRELLGRAVSSTEGSELELPHIVVCGDRQTGATTYVGPFPDAVAALSFAESESCSCDELSLSWTVAALHPPGDPT